MTMFLGVAPRLHAVEKNHPLLRRIRRTLMQPACLLDVHVRARRELRGLR
jgi:hypothetical protein